LYELIYERELGLQVIDEYSIYNGQGIVGGR